MAAVVVVVEETVVDEMHSMLHLDRHNVNDVE